MLFLYQTLGSESMAQLLLLFFCSTFHSAFISSSVKVNALSFHLLVPGPAQVLGLVTQNTLKARLGLNLGVKKGFKVNQCHSFTDVLK